MSLIEARRDKSILPISASLFVAFALAISLVSSGCSQLMSNESDGGRASSAPSRQAPGGKTSSAGGLYSVTFGVKNNAGRLGAVQFSAQPREAGTWQGEGANVECRNVSGPSMHACNEKSGSVLSCGFIDTNGIATPTDLVTCSFKSTKAISKDDFSVKVIDATNTATKPVKADVEVTRVTAK